MNIICKKNELINAINTVQKAVPAKTPYPILEGIFVKAGENLELTANDLEIGIECTVEAEILQQGEVVIDSALLGNIIRKMPDSEITIKVEQNENVVISCQNSKFEIKGTKGDGYPQIPGVEGIKSLNVSQAVIKDMIRQTIFAVGEDENRPILNGVNMVSKSGNLTLVAIDGFRLALRKCAIDDIDSNIDVIIPGKTLNNIGRILEISNNEATIHIADNQIMFDLGKTKIVSRLIEGEFFKYENIIPEDYETRLKVNRSAFLESIDRVAVLISSDGSHYPANIFIKNDKMVITINSAIGNVREELSVEMTGKDMEVRYNPRFFIEALKEIDEERIDVSFNSEVGPCIIKSLDKDTFVYMLLPLRK